jgi:hypothetical protein
MRAALGLYQRPAIGTARLPYDIDSLARGYKRATRAIGGYWTGSFDISGEDATPGQLREFFDSWLGCVVKEYTGGMPTWEGMVYSMNLVLDGAEYHISLEPEWFHNDTEVVYSSAAVVDINQGALSYTTEGGLDTFTDASQDFTDWETAAGDAAYRIQVANSNGTVSWAYLGAAVGATEIYIYTDSQMTTNGWNDQNPAGLTPSSYQVIQVSLENSRATTGQLADDDGQAEFGQMEYIVSLAGASSTAAAALRARHNEEFSWPRARFINQGRAQNSLSVTLAGFWYTLFWRYRRTSQTAAANVLISAIVAESEWVSAGRVDANTLEVTADAYPIPQRLGNLLERVAEHGDASGNAWRCGVYAGRKLHYEQSPATIEYYTRGGRLLDRAGQAVIPEFVTPGVLVQARSNSRITPPGAPTWARSGATYVDQVEYDRDTGALRLSLADEPFSIITLTEQIQSGAG